MRAKITRGALNLHAWVYKIETGDVFAYSDEEKRFQPLGQMEGTPLISASRAHV